MWQGSDMAASRIAPGFRLPPLLPGSAPVICLRRRVSGGPQELELPMPSPLRSILSCLRPTPPAEERASTSTSRPADSTAHAPRRAPVTLQGLASFAAQRMRERQVEIKALEPDTRRALSDGECQLGGYVHARQTDGRPVEGRQLDRLVRANETVMETRQALSHGRGNVVDDIHDSNGQSTIRAVAGRVVRTQLPSNYGPGVSIAASAMAAQAGNCGEHANVAAFLHAAKLGSGEYAYAVGSTTIDHRWAQWHAARARDPDHDLVMDPWGKGPAIFAVDGEFAGGQHDVGIEREYDQSTGAKAHADMSELQRDHHQQMQTNLHVAMEHLGPDFRLRDGAVFAVTPVISSEFAARVSQKMSAAPDAAKLAPKNRRLVRQAKERIRTGEPRMAPLRQEIHATQTARTLGASGVREVTQAAARIAQVAADLENYPLASHPAQTAPENL